MTKVRLVIATCVLLAVAAVSYGLTRGDRAEVVAQDSGSNTKTIEFQGVRVEIPARWERRDLGSCEFEFEHWSPPGADPCFDEGGVAFYASATFDAAFGPGVRREDDSGSGVTSWAGYTDAGEWAVYASDPSRDVVKAVLDSVRTVEGD